MPIRNVLHIAKMTGVAGMENHLLTLLPGLKAKGLDVHLLILTAPDTPMDSYAARMTALGVPTLQTPIHGRVDMGLFWRLGAFMRGFDAVHTHLIHADIYGVLAARRARIRYIFMTGHNDDPFRRQLPIRLVQFILWRQITKGIAISDAIRRFQIKIEGAPPQRVVTIHYGLAVDHIHIGAATREIIRNELGIPLQVAVAGSVCRLVTQKGIGDALRAFWLVSRQIPDAHYVIVGEGPLRASLEAEAESYGLAHRIHFLGWRDDAQAVMSAFDVFVAPSHWEGFGLAVLEAMAVRIPVIATNVSALPEIIVADKTGYLTPPDDVQALMQAMIDVFTYPTQAHEMGEAGRQRVETEFSAARMIDQTAALYANSST